MCTTIQNTVCKKAKEHNGVYNIPSWLLKNYTHLISLLYAIKRLNKLVIPDALWWQTGGGDSVINLCTFREKKHHVSSLFKKIWCWGDCFFNSFNISDISKMPEDKHRAYMTYGSLGNKFSRWEVWWDIWCIENLRNSILAALIIAKGTPRPHLSINLERAKCSHVQLIAEWQYSKASDGQVPITWNFISAKVPR